MAVDSSHSHPLYARVGNTEFVIAWLKLPAATGRPIDPGPPVNDGQPEVVDLDEAAVESLRRRLGLTPPYRDADAERASERSTEGTEPGSERSADTKTGTTDTDTKTGTFASGGGTTGDRSARVESI